MAKLTAAQLYAANRAAGFDPAQATIMTAIDLAESGGDDANVSDVALEDSTWGPSFGFPQIRTLKAQTGTGSDRDINALAGNDAAQAKAAFDISAHGKDFTPWTEYVNGGYRGFLGQAQSAAGSSFTGGLVTLVGDPAPPPGPAPTFGPDWLPWNWPSNAINASVASGLSGARTIAVEALFVVLGVGLVAAGLAVTVSPSYRALRGKANRAGAKVAAVL